MICRNHRHDSGISLLEFVLGIALLGLVLAGGSLFFYGQQKQRLDPVFQVRAVSLAQALSEQLFAVKYDEQNKPEQQSLCAANCTNVNQFGSDANESGLADFDDVDDFHDWCEPNDISGDQLATAMGLDADYYQGYGVSVCVTEGAVATYKVVEIKVSPPAGASIDFVLHRYNIR
ncbi:prepilin-type cleavage/methylation-like protein [Zobellella maritima]|uniref:prepilin-type cleavage/methylation-like protein n=1 Tax=Zobellella maritima TaxID=2059725 RepID=UPI00130068AC|nr:prepilin-type cleavage/methylation-like protein [Zobellella maritima]